MHAWLQDFRYAVRVLRKNPVLTVVMVASLTVGIGANTAVFSVVDALLLRPLPYPQPERLANVWLHSPGLGIFRDWPSPGQYIDIILGKSMTLDGKPFIVAGVLRREFMLNSELMPSEGPIDKLDVFLPLPLAADAEQSRRDENYNILVRLKGGVSVQQAQADIDLIASRIREKDKRDTTFGMHVVTLQEPTRSSRNASGRTITR